MSDAVPLLRACRDNPGDFTAYLVAADFFDDSEGGAEPTWGRALRWMAENQKWPRTVLVTAQTVRDQPSAVAYEWWSGVIDPRSSGAPEDLPAHCVLPRDVARAAFGFAYNAGQRYYAWAAALSVLATALVKVDLAAARRAPPSPPLAPSVVAALAGLFGRPRKP